MILSSFIVKLALFNPVNVNIKKVEHTVNCYGHFYIYI